MFPGAMQALQRDLLDVHSLVIGSRRCAMFPSTFGLWGKVMKQESKDESRIP